MPSLTDIPTTALVYRRMIAPTRPALAVPAVLILPINPTSLTASLPPSRLSMEQPYAFSRCMSTCYCRPHCALDGHGPGRRAESLPTASTLPSGLPMGATPQGKLCRRNCLSWRGSYSESKETHWHLVLELYSDLPMYDAEGAEHILLSKYFTIVQRRSKLKENKRWLEAMQ